MPDFIPKAKERGNVILAQDWNTAMDEIVRLGNQVEFLDKSALKPVAGKLSADLTIAGALSVTGNATVGAAGSVFFENRTRQMLNLWGAGYGIGIQNYTQYFRTDKSFAWYKGGSHDDAELSAGGGTLQMVIRDGQVGIGTASPQAKLHVTGAMKIDGSNTLEFGAGVDGKQVDAGKIGYQTWTPGALDIVGGGSAGGNRKIKFWAEGGATFGGDLTVSGKVGIGIDNPSATLEVNGAIKAAKFVGDGSELTGIALPEAPESQWSDLADGIQYKTGAKVTIGAANSGTSLQIMNKNQDAGGDTLVIGRLEGTHLRFGYHGSYGWIQSQTDKPLAINPLGGKVGIGTTDPQTAFDVAGGYIVMRQAADPATAGELLDKLPKSSLVIGGPSGDTIAFFWKDENGRRHQLSLKGDALTA